MKYTLLVIASIGLIFAACKKKSTMTHCYVCNQYDSTYYNGGVHSRPNGISDTMCNQTPPLIEFFVKNHVKYDTFYRNTDSQSTGYTYFRCDQTN